jgi:hypothetical protein
MCIDHDFAEHSFAAAANVFFGIFKGRRHTHGDAGI